MILAAWQFLKVGGSAVFGFLRTPAGLAVLALVVGLYGGCTWKQREWDKDVAEARAATATKAVATVTKQRTETAKVETVYVDKLKEVPTLTAGLVAACVGVRQYTDSTGRTRMSESTGMADPPSGADADTRQFCEEVAAGYAAGLRNTAKADACAGWVLANGGGKD